jgi:outer membrane receptor protein involved in Fe transport
LSKPVTFQLNVSNLLDYRDPIFKSTTVYQGTAYRNAFNYLEPRNVTLTVKFDL